MRGEEHLTTETSIYEYAKQGLSHGADRVAISFYGRDMTYGELFEKIDNVADHLYALGVREGTVVTIHLPNCPQAVIAIYAVAKLGGVCNMVHALTPKAALCENLLYTESAFLITHLRDCMAETSFCIDLSAHMDLETQARYRSEHDCFGATFEAMEETDAACAAQYPTQEALAETCAFYLHSGGSTGKPKTIMLSHSAMNHCVDNTADFFEKRDMADQVSLGVLPLFHGFGLAADVHRNIHFGSHLVMMTRWNPSEAANLIKHHGVTLIVGVPSMFYSLLSEPTFQEPGISQLAYCYTGGDTVNPELIEMMDRRLGREQSILPGFGLTEATTMNCVNTYVHYKAGSAGYPVRNTTIAVLDPDDKLHPCGRGELVISSPTRMMGYFKDPEATEYTLFSAEGKLWVRTGDSVEIDEEGFLFFRDRIKNIIIHNGYNVYPGEVERVIRRVPGVDAVCVVGVIDNKTHSQMIRAVVVSKVGSIEQQIREECLMHLPRYAVPKEYIFVDRLPTNAVGKVDRQVLC